MPPVSVVVTLRVTIPHAEREDYTAGDYATMKVRAALLISLLAVLAGLSGCNGGSGATGNPGVVKIYSSLPRTGNARQQTDTIVNGIRMALDDVNSRVGDFKVEYYDGDDATASAGAWTAEQESANARDAAADPDVMVYIG